MTKYINNSNKLSTKNFPNFPIFTNFPKFFHFISSSPSLPLLFLLSFMLFFSSILVPLSNHITLLSQTKALEEQEEATKEIEFEDHTQFIFSSPNLSNLKNTSKLTFQTTFKKYSPYTSAISPAYKNLGVPSYIYTNKVEYINDPDLTLRENYIAHVNAVVNNFPNEILYLKNLKMASLSKAVILFGVYNNYYISELTLKGTKTVESLDNESIVFNLVYSNIRDIKDKEDEFIKELMFLNTKVMEIYQNYRELDQSLIEEIDNTKEVIVDGESEEWGNIEEIVNSNSNNLATEEEIVGEGEIIEKDPLLKIIFRVSSSLTSEVEYLEIVNGQVRWLNRGR